MLQACHGRATTARHSRAVCSACTSSATRTPNRRPKVSGSPTRRAPSLRAVQTAELLATALGSEHVRVLDELRPGNSAAQLLGALRAMAACSVMLVGHDRQLCELAAQLSGVACAAAAELRLQCGAIVRIDVRQLEGAPTGKPRWWIGPDRAQRDGLPTERSR